MESTATVVFLLTIFFACAIFALITYKISLAIYSFGLVRLRTLLLLSSTTPAFDIVNYS